RASDEAHEESHMVICSACPTHQPAGAAWYRCGLHSDTPMTLKNLCGFHKSTKGHGKPAKSLAPQRRSGSVQRPLASAPVRRCWIPAASLELVRQFERPHASEISPCVAVLLLRATSDGRMPPDQKQNDKYRRAKWFTVK